MFANNKCLSLTLVKNCLVTRVSAGIMRRFVLWDTACNFNDVIQKFKNLKCLITGTSTLFKIAI